MKGAAAGALYYLLEIGSHELPRVVLPLFWETLSPSGREAYYYLSKHAAAEEETGFLLEEDK